MKSTQNMLNAEGFFNNIGAVVGVSILVIAVFAVVFICVIFRKKIADKLNARKSAKLEKLAKKKAGEAYAASVFANQNNNGPTSDEDMINRIQSKNYGKLSGAETIKKESTSSAPRTAKEMLTEIKTGKAAALQANADIAKQATSMFENKSMTSANIAHKSAEKLTDAQRAEREAQQHADAEKIIRTMGNMDIATKGEKKDGNEKVSLDDAAAMTGALRNSGIITDAKSNTVKTQDKNKEKNDIAELENIERVVSGYTNTGMRGNK